jgi:hypothetical protein
MSQGESQSSMWSSMIIVVLLFSLVAMCSGAEWMFELPVLLSAGWIPFIKRTIAEFSSDWSAVIALCAFLLLGAGAFHFVARRIAGSRQKVWNWAWSVRISIMVLALFGTSIALAGILHQVEGMTNTPRWVGRGGSIGRDITNARQLIIAVRLHAAEEGGRYPAQLEGLLASGYVEGFESLEKLSTYVGEGNTLPASWIYVRGLNDSAPAGLPLIIAPHTYKGGKRIIGTNDASVELWNAEHIREALPGWKEGLAALGIPLPEVLKEYDMPAPAP